MTSQDVAAICRYFEMFLAGDERFTTRDVFEKMKRDGLNNIGYDSVIQVGEGFYNTPGWDCIILLHFQGDCAAWKREGAVERLVCQRCGAQLDASREVDGDWNWLLCDSCLSSKGSN